MARCKDDCASSVGRVRKVAKSIGLETMDPRRKELCIVGVELCVLKDSDIIYILTGAETESAAERRLKTCIARA